MKMRFLLFIIFLIGCSTEQQKPTSLYEKVSTLDSIEGKADYLASPFVTAGDRVYLVGFQNGTFPDLGWHIDDEMGGIWDHPIKLMDGFMAAIQIKDDTTSFCLNNANKFINYPMANRHHFEWTSESIGIDRTQFIPDSLEGVIIEYRFTNHGNEKKELVFSFTGMTDLRPTWLGERTNMKDDEDEISFDKTLSAVIAKDKGNPWYTAFGSWMEASYSPELKSCATVVRKGLGKEAKLSYSFTMDSGGELTIPLFIAGSYQSEESLRSTFDELKNHGRKKLAQKIIRYEKINNTSHLTIPDKGVEQMFEWLKYNSDWLVRHVPEQGTGLSAGLPDYPWWFGADATYALQGILATGDHELVKNTILLLHKISKQTNKNGRIIHEVSTNGSVYNPGNINETAQFVTLVNNYYKWTGDKELVAQLFPDLKNGMKWLLEEKDPDGNHYPNGSGMMEIPGLESQLEMIDVAVYTQQALASGAELARALGEKTIADEYQKLANDLRMKINNEWWQPNENSFGDFRGTVAEATPVLEAAMIRCDTLEKTWAVEELKSTQKMMRDYPKHKIIPHVIYHNWVVNTPMETGIADTDKAKAALKKAKTYENPFGVFVTGIDRTEEADSVVLKSRKKTFSYTGAVMTLPTSVMAISAANYGNSDEALSYINKLHQSFSYALPGSMYEVSPDFGMMTQAWNIYGIAVPIVRNFFGIQPKAFEKSIYLSPNLPQAWKEASLDNVRVGENSISINIQVKDDHKEYITQQLLSDWTIIFDVTGAKKIVVNNQEIDFKPLSNNQLKMTGKQNVVKVY